MSLNKIFLLFFLTISFTYSEDSIKPDAPLSVLQKQELDSIKACFNVIPCNANLEKAIYLHPPCRIALHLYPFASWLVLKGKTYKECMKDLSDRQAGFLDIQHYTIDLSSSLYAGNKSGVVIVAYMSALCPLCKYITTELYKEVTNGLLKDKACLVIKPCNANQANRALVAAGHFNKQWEYLSALHNNKLRPDEPILLKIADSLQIPQSRFKEFMNKNEIQTTLANYSNEAVRNGVTIAPTFFIDNKRYKSYKDPKWIVDAALYEYEKTKFHYK
jgi:hypothetical protein